MISGRINPVPSISAVVDFDRDLVLKIHGGKSISASINPIIDILGSINGVADVEGTLDYISTITGSVKIPTIIKADTYEGEYEVIPKSFEQELATKSKNMKDDVLVHEIPYYETSNLTGTTVYIGGD